jgi:hypothetical protein
MSEVTVSTVGEIKQFRSHNYNYNFNVETGYFERWGATQENDPLYSPSGPEILDIEIASGGCKGGCTFCYKGNTPDLPIKYMSMDTYIKLFDKINVPTLTQIAFGITDIDANPDFWDIIKYTRRNNIIPNYTTNGIGITKDIAERTAMFCGAVAISVYKHNKEKAYDAIKTYIDAGMTQVNIHFMLAQETLVFACEILVDIKTDIRLKGLNAIVFLQYKDKNPDAHFHSPNFLQFKDLIDCCLDMRIRFGFDSCSSAMFMKAVANREDSKELIQYVDNCESFGLFSGYINVNCYFYPCSFAEGIGEWLEGTNVLEVNEFLTDIWFSPKLSKYRELSLTSTKECICEFSKVCRTCLIYEKLSRCTN